MTKRLFSFIDKDLSTILYFEHRNWSTSTIHWIICSNVYLSFADKMSPTIRFFAHRNRSVCLNKQFDCKK